MKTRHLLVLLALLCSLATARAQLELRAGNFNNIFVAQTATGAAASPSGPPVVSNPPPTSSQFSAMGQVAGSAGPILNTAVIADRFPSNPENTIVLVRATIGGVFTSGVPLYSLGEIITPPLTQVDGTTPAASDYWRLQPILPGEFFPGVNGGNPIIPLGTVTVTSATINSSVVTVNTPIPPALVVGATLLGQPVTRILGSSVTLAGNANSSISSATAVPITPELSFYYSPHSEKAYASQAGRVTISWVTRVPVGGNHASRTQDFAVSSTTKLPLRTIYWTEGSFDGPKVQIPDTRITTVSPAYYSLVPKAVTEEVIIPGYSSPTPNLATLSFERFSGIGQLKAYNVEGRILVEYLGNARLTGNIYESLGIDVIELVRVPEANFATVHLGSEITPHEPAVNIAPPPGPGTTARASAKVVNGVVTGMTILDGGSGYGSTPPVVSVIGPVSATPAVALAILNQGMVTGISVIDGGSGYPELTPSPVIGTLQNDGRHYGTTVRPDGSTAYFAERETSGVNSPDNGAPASQEAYNRVVFYWMEEGDFSIRWPKFQDRYWLRWSPHLSDYAHYTVDPSGSTPETGVPFIGGSLPTITYQDDPAQNEARMDLTSQRLVVNFAANSDKRNRSLLKFSAGAEVWYVNLYTQAENRAAVLASTSDTAGGVTTVTVGSTAALEVGMIVTGPGITGSATVTRIIDATRLVLSQNILDATNTLSYTVQSDALAPINTTATVGTRLTQPAGHEIGGYISGGNGYFPAGYRNPFLLGVEAANKGAIIPVNALPSDKLLTVRWFKKIPAPGAGFQDLYVPGKIGRYTVSYPASTSPEIVIAQGVGTNDLSPAQQAGSIYYQNDSSLPGYNPNEEHALTFVPRAYAMREDLNVTSGSGYTSEPFVLVAYTDPADQRPAIQAYKVVRTNATYTFDYTATAGTLLAKPYPLPLVPEPLFGSGANRQSKNLEIFGADLPGNATVGTNPAYNGFTYEDRKGFTWVHRGPHASGSPTLSMKLYYPSREGFFIPGIGVPAEGTILPFLRNASRSGQTLNINAIDSNADGTPGEIDEPLTIIYRAAWPTDAPELRVGETLALPKFGLPQVRGQKSAQVLYQQSIATAPTASQLTKNSVLLHDPTREKTVRLDAPGVNLNALPNTIKTTEYQGKIYFQGLPPHLQRRIFLDPTRSQKGTLVFIGTFEDEIAGEDYFNLNLLTAAEELVIKDLVATGATDETKWDAAIEALNTEVETFVPDPARIGSYIIDPVLTKNVGENDLASIGNQDTAADSYAVTATGQGTGFVTMVFGDGGNPDRQPQGDPVQVKVFKIANQLYVGDLKVIQSSNPLDEQVTLRHSGDFAGKPEDYEFEWRWAPGAATAPQFYSTTMVERIGNPVNSTQNWSVVRDPGSLKPTAAQYTAAGAALPFPRTENVRPVNYVLDAQNQPTSTVIDATSYTDAEIAQGYPSIVAKSSAGVDFTGGVPGSVIFSANLGDFDGFVLYVNDRAALAFNAPTPQFTLTNSSTGLSAGGLGKQFNIEPSYFRAGPNTIEVAIYSTADPNTQSSLDFSLEAAQETDLVDSSVTPNTIWQTPSDPTGINTNFARVGGSTALPFGGPTFVLNDRWFTMRYRPKASANNVLGTPYSRWMPPQLVEGWIKRVLASIQPFEQKVKDLYNNSVDTDVSVITQAGKRWEGDIALTLDNIDDVGLIEIYETVLNRGRSLSIDANTNDPDSNNALLLAAGYLNDLYTILGNEAFADAANPTISIDDGVGSSEVNTSRFSFEAQVESSLSEELALLRGRDDSVSPGVNIGPAYNRLYWNYTRGINSGEVIYAVNYNIKEKVGSSTADGIIDEADAQRMFPQGHGDAYGHYLTALKGYYKLLSNSNFTWTPRGEAVTVLGQPVTVDFLDERKFAAAAGNVARTAEQVAALTYRQTYKDDPAAGWTSYRDSKPSNTATDVKSAQGLDEWVSRGAQGSYYHWAVANALLPDVDNVNTGVQKIDRSTVPEIAKLAGSAQVFQTTIDNASARLNPLGLSPGAIAFDLEPFWMTSLGQELASPENVGRSHYEQISARALRALNNARGAFDQAASRTRSLRDQQNQIDDYSTTIAQQEIAYTNQLIDIFGRPFSGDIGAGRLYPQGYTGPDFHHWFIVDRPESVVDTSKAFQIQTTEATAISEYTSDTLQNIINPKIFPVEAQRDITVTVQPSQWVQYADVWKPGGMGSRAESGELQAALQDAQQTWLALSDLNVRWGRETAQLDHLARVFKDLVNTQIKSSSELSTRQAEILRLEALVRDRETTAASFDDLADVVQGTFDSTAEFFPKVLGLANDVTSSGRGALRLAGILGYAGFKTIALSTRAGAAAQQGGITVQQQQLEYNLQQLGFSRELVQLAYEYDNIYRSSVSGANELMQLTLAHQRALQNVNNVLARANRIRAERQIFNQRAAAIIQGYRTKDLTFRIFRNEALEQYRSLFDLASRYSYLAAKSYDYETGLLGTAAGQRVFDRIVASRSLGDLTNGVPQATTSTLGDAGLAGTMAQLNADFAAVEGRLGINNPDFYGTLFSLRRELYRLIPHDEANAGTPAYDATGDDAWQQRLEQLIVPNVLADSDVVTQCRNIVRPDGRPVPGIIIPFSTTIEHGKNFFGLDLAAGDHNYTPSNYATKISNVGIVFNGYIGMDSYSSGSSGAPNTSDPNALSATPHIYFIPCGSDYMLSPPLGDTNTLRAWNVKDQALPLPYNLGGNDFNGTQFFNANGTLSEQPWVIRKHQAFRAVADPNIWYGSPPLEFTNSRLIGRSVWNGQWKIVIPAYTLLNNEKQGLDRFVASVKDIQLFLRTYSNSGN